MLWFMFVAPALASESMHFEFADADAASSLRFLATVGDINFIASAPPTSAPVSGTFTTRTVRELFDRVSEAQGYHSADSAGLIVLSGVPLGRALSSGPHSGRGLSVDLQGASFRAAIRFIGDVLDCTPLVAWDDVLDSVSMRIQQVPADQALDALMAIGAQTGICTPGGFLDRTGTGEDHRLTSMPARAQQAEPQHLPPGVTLRRRRSTWLIEAPPAEIRTTRQLIREGRQEAEPPMEMDGPGWLQGYPLHRLSLVGTATGSAQPAALIVDPSGNGHTVVSGSYVGQNWGRVTAISPASITVTEEYMPMKGEIATSAVVMQLGQPASPPAGR